MFYIYGLIDSSTGECFYVGKGSTTRMYTHVQKVKRGDSTSNPHLDRKIAKLLSQGTEIVYIKYHNDIVDENEAYALEEAKTIELGLDNLCNAWHGGKGGRVPSKETREKISRNRRGIPVSVETREKIRQAHTGMVMSEETREKKRQALKGKPQTPAQKDANVARGNALKSRVFTEEHKQKLRDAKKRKIDEQHNE